jgi:hypothetical protein
LRAILRGIKENAIKEFTNFSRKKQNNFSWVFFSASLLIQLVYISGMNDEQKHAMAKDVLSSELKKRLYLYSFIFLIVLSVVDLLIFIIDLIVDAQDSAARMPSLICSYLGIAFAAIALFLMAILSALYFVKPDEDVGSDRIRAVSRIRITIRGFGLAAGVTFIISSALGLAGGSDKPLNLFNRGWGIAIAVLEGLMFIYALWHDAWIRENPEKFMTPVFPAKSKGETPAERPQTSEAPKAEVPDKKDEAIEVEAHYQKPAQLTHEEKKKKTTKK